MSNEVATAVIVSGAFPIVKTASPVLSMLCLFKISTAYLKIKGTVTFKTFEPINNPTAILTLFLISGSS